MQIILDTNILAQDFRMQSNLFKSFFGFIIKTGSDLVLPDIVFQEVLSVYKREIDANVKKTNSALSKLDNLLFNSEKTKLNISIHNEVDSYKNKLLSNNPTLLLPNSLDNFSESVKRLLNAQKPASEKRNEYRDVLIWLSIKDYLRYRKSKDLAGATIFISNNIKEFRSTQNTLAPQLLDELKSEELTLQFYDSIENFLKDNSPKVDYITADWIKDKLNWEVIDDIINEHLTCDEDKIKIYLKCNKDVYYVDNIEIVEIISEIDENYFVVDIDKEDMFLYFTVYSTINISFIKEEYDYEGVYKHKMDESIEVLVSFSSKIINDSIVSIEYDHWEFF